MCQVANTRMCSEKKMRTKIRTARPKTGLQHMHLLHNNFSAHKSLTVAQVLKSEKVNVLSHPPYSPDLAPRDLFLSDIEKKNIW